MVVVRHQRVALRHAGADERACVGSTSPWMMFRIEMYLLWLKSLLRVCVETMMFFVCSRRRMTSSTVVLRTLQGGARQKRPVCTHAQAHTHVDVVCRSSVSGVYPVIRKWQRGVGMSEATRPTKSLFM